MQERNLSQSSSFVDALKNHLPLMEDTGILEDFMAKLSPAPDKDTLWMRLSKTVDLHIKNCEGLLKSSNSVLPAKYD